MLLTNVWMLYILLINVFNILQLRYLRFNVFCFVFLLMQSYQKQFSEFLSVKMTHGSFPQLKGLSPQISVCLFGLY